MLHGARGRAHRRAPLHLGRGLPLLAWQLQRAPLDPRAVVHLRLDAQQRAQGEPQLAGLLLVIIPLGAAHLVMSFQGTPLEPLALVRLAVLGIAVWLAGLLWGAPKRLPPASLARHIVRCVTKTRVHIALQRSLP